MRFDVDERQCFIFYRRMGFIKTNGDTINLTKPEQVIFDLVCKNTPLGISSKDLLALAITQPGNQTIRTIHTNIYTINKKFRNLPMCGPRVVFDRGSKGYKINESYMLQE